MNDRRDTPAAIVIKVPPVEPGEAEMADMPDAESRAVGAHPEFQALLKRGRQAFAEGKGMAAEEIFRELGLDEATGETPAHPAASENASRKRSRRRTASR